MIISYRKYLNAELNSAFKSELKPIDVICQHSRDEKITPIKIRVVDEDGEYQEYRIKGSVRAGHTDDAGRRVREQHYPDI